MGTKMILAKSMNVAGETDPCQIFISFPSIKELWGQN